MNNGRIDLVSSFHRGMSNSNISSDSLPRNKWPFNGSSEELGQGNTWTSHKLHRKSSSHNDLLETIKAELDNNDANFDQFI